jgi:predicted nucleotidyltransferase
MYNQSSNYLEAKNQAVEYIKQNFTNLVAIIVGGSIIREEYNAFSDFDIYVIHNNNFRKRVYKFFNGIACDIFINNLSHIEDYFAKEYINNRPVTANIISTGEIVLGKDRFEVKGIIKKSIIYANTSYKPKYNELILKKIELLTYLEDIEDILKIDFETSNYLMNNLITKSIDLFFIIEKIPLPRIKNRIKFIENQKKEFSLLIKKFYFTNDLNEKYINCKKIVQYLTDKTKLDFDWETKDD